MVGRGAAGEHEAAQGHAGECAGGCEGAARGAVLPVELVRQVLSLSGAVPALVVSKQLAGFRTWQPELVATWLAARACRWRNPALRHCHLRRLLCAAAYVGHTRVCEALLQQPHADVVAALHAADGNALMDSAKAAAAGGQHTTLRWLVEDKYARVSPLMIIKMEKYTGDAQLLLRLLQHGAQPSCTKLAMATAAEQGDLRLVMQMRGAFNPPPPNDGGSSTVDMNVGSLDSYGVSGAILGAARRGHAELLKLLLPYARAPPEWMGGGIEDLHRDLEMAASAAVDNGHQECVRLIAAALRRARVAEGGVEEGMGGVGGSNGSHGGSGVHGDGDDMAGLLMLARDCWGALNESLCEAASAGRVDMLRMLLPAMPQQLLEPQPQHTPTLEGEQLIAPVDNTPRIRFAIVGALEAAACAGHTDVMVAMLDAAGGDATVGRLMWGAAVKACTWVSDKAAAWKVVKTILTHPAGTWLGQLVSSSGVDDSGSSDPGTHAAPQADAVFTEAVEWTLAADMAAWGYVMSTAVGAGDGAAVTWLLGLLPSPSTDIAPLNDLASQGVSHALHAASIVGDLGVVQQLLMRWPGLTVLRDFNYQHALKGAICAGHERVVCELAGSLPHCCYGVVAAAHAGRLDLMQLLVERAREDLEGLKQQITLPQLEHSQLQTDVAAVLAASQPPVEAEDITCLMERLDFSDGDGKCSNNANMVLHAWTCNTLYSAALSGHTHVVHAIVGSRPHMLAAAGVAALSAAAMNGRLAVVEQLLALGVPPHVSPVQLNNTSRAVVDASTGNGGTAAQDSWQPAWPEKHPPLVSAARAGHEPVVRALLHFKPPPDEVALRALKAAAGAGHADVVHTLLQAMSAEQLRLPANSNSSVGGHAALQAAIHNCRFEAVCELMDTPAGIADAEPGCLVAAAIRAGRPDVPKPFAATEHDDRRAALGTAIPLALLASGSLPEPNAKQRKKWALCPAAVHGSELLRAVLAADISENVWRQTQHSLQSATRLWGAAGSLQDFMAKRGVYVHDV